MPGSGSTGPARPWAAGWERAGTVKARGSPAERAALARSRQGQAAVSCSRADKELGASVPPGATPKPACLRPSCLQAQAEGGWGRMMGCDSLVQPLEGVPSPEEGPQPLRVSTEQSLL